jgi:Uma2 family endonuclease
VVSEAKVIELHYRIEPALEAWVLPEVEVPESRLHDLIARHLVELLDAWLARSGLDAIVARNLAIRWLRDAPRVGVDPDVCLIRPAPPDPDRMSSLCLWKPGTSAPVLAIEIVSEHHPYKDYAAVQEKYAACGVEELWVLDPLLVGPRRLGGPVPLQIWRRTAEGAFARCFTGKAPYQSSVVGAWIAVTEGGVWIADDARGESRWLTPAEQERAAKETERAAKETERAKRLELERQVKDLEARLRERG